MKGVERLERFHEMVVEDPLFAAEGMDTEAAHRALNDIVDTVSILESEFSKESFLKRLFIARYPIAKHALPVPFLRAFVESERTRRTYLAEPSRENAERLSRSWSDTARLLETCALRYHALHRTLRSLEGASDSFVFEDRFGNTSSAKFIHKFLDQLVENAKLAREHAKHRSDLLRGVSTDTAFSRTPSGEVIDSKTGSMSPEHAYIHSLEVRDSLPFRHVDISETHGPIRIALSNFDGSPTEHDFMLYVYRDKKNGRAGMHVGIVDRFYFYELDEKHNYRFNDIGLVNYRSLTSRGISHWYEQATHLYTMRDQRYWMNVASAVDLRRRPSLDRGAVLKQRSSMLDLFFDAFVRHLEFNVGYALRRKRNKTVRTYSAYRGVITHTYPSAYYLTFNRSVWRLSEEPACLADGRASSNERAYLSDDEVLPNLPPGMIEKIMRGSRFREEDEVKEGFSVYQ